jgi:uncharacterized protein (TIGR00369 family)
MRRAYARANASPDGLKIVSGAATCSLGLVTIDPGLVRLVQLMEELIPFNRVLGLRVEQLRPGFCVVRLPWRDELIGDPMRPAVHGGVLSALADTAGGLACFSLLTSPEDRVSTVDLRIDYLRPGPALDVLCHAKTIRMGNRVAVARMTVFAGSLPPPDQLEDNPIATGQAVYNVVRRGD